MSVFFYIQELGCDHIDDLLHELRIEYRKIGQNIQGRCPIHGGDNPTALTIYPDGQTKRGHWVCWTHHCERKWKPTLLGFIRGVLARENKNITEWAATLWLLKFLGYKSIREVKIPSERQTHYKAITTVSSFLQAKPQQSVGKWSRQQIQDMLNIPATYYSERGYTEEILKKYDVGFYSPLNRVAIPVYDDGYKRAVGFSARSIYNQCPHCQLYHSKETKCPQDEKDRLNASKWRHSRGFLSGNHLYNYWFARQYITKTGTAILVEGPGDVWRLEENNIHNSLALFGCNLTTAQQILLEQSGVMSIIVLLDSDEAGINGA